MVENGVKPVYVFDGKPPEMKSGELAKRAERREEAQKQLEAAEETGNSLKQKLIEIFESVCSLISYDQVMRLMLTNLLEGWLKLIPNM